MCEPEERRLTKVWNDMIHEESQHCPSVFVQVRVARMCELHFAAGRDFEREQEPKCRSALEKIRRMFYDDGTCYAYDADVGVYRTTEILDMIERGLSTAAAEPEPPTPTLKDLREAAGYSLYSLGAILEVLTETLEHYEEGAATLPTDLTNRIRLVYGIDYGVVQAAAIEARRNKQRKESDE